MGTLEQRAATGKAVVRANSCTSVNASNSGHDNNPSTRCNIVPEELIFVKYGGEVLRSRYLCRSLVRRVCAATATLETARPMEGFLAAEETAAGCKHKNAISKNLTRERR